MSFAAPISEYIWDEKYRFKKFNGEPIDLTIKDTWMRVAKQLAEPEQEKSFWTQVFYNTLEDFKFIPAGRIIAGSGTNREVTLNNCYVMGTIPDSMSGIFDMLKEAALTMQQGGGIGYDFSTIRPKGTEVKGVGAEASGPLSFMDCWNAMCLTVMSAGTRRGAMMATMRCDHPNVLDFIKAKREPGKLSMFNLSVLVTDDFMEAVKNDADWELNFNGRVYETVKAKFLWDQIMEATYNYAEPGVIFIDRINKNNNLYYCETIAATNPCGEQPLPPYGACLLGSINLAKFVKDSFTVDAHIDYASLRNTVRAAVRMMDNVIEVSKYPLELQKKDAKDKRRIGLGVTGLADMLFMLGVTYGSEKALEVTDKILSIITHTAYHYSVDLAVEKGEFPLLDRMKYVNSEFIKNLSPLVKERILKHGIRNSHLTSIAPTGTISLLSGNISSGIEPIFATSYTRKVLQKDGTKTEEEVVDYAVAQYRKLNQRLFDHCLVTAQDLPPKAHLDIQAVAQKWIDSSISKTINLPASISFQDFEDVYLYAYENGCKGCTTYRPNDITGSVLEVKEEQLEVEIANNNHNINECPSCGEFTLKQQEGCATCPCGFGLCG